METLVVLLVAILLITLAAIYFDRRPRYYPLSLQAEQPGPPERELRLSRGASAFVRRLFGLALLARLVVATFLNLTNSITDLRLSPDSERYHREGTWIAQQMATGDFNWPNWIDNGWFQFTGYVYYLFGPHPILMQLINVVLGSLTPVVVFYLVWRAYRVERVARRVAILVAFFPSFIYWSCLMLKDPVSILAVSCVALAVLGLRDGIRLRWIALLAIALTVILGVREYLVFVLAFLVLVCFLPVDGRGTGSALARLGIIALLVGVGLYFAGFGFLGVDYIAQSHYFDLEYINSSRVAISHGGGAFFKTEETPLWGESLTSTLEAAGAAVFYFFVTLDLTDIGGTRQLMALPEVLLILVLLPSLARGLRYSWTYHRQATWPLMVFAFGLLAVYGSATTNMGAMFRWRMQAMPFLVTFMVAGVLSRRQGFLYRMLSRVKL